MINGFYEVWNANMEYYHAVKAGSDTQIELHEKANNLFRKHVAEQNRFTEWNEFCEMRILKGE